MEGSLRPLGLEKEIWEEMGAQAPTLHSLPPSEASAQLAGTWGTACTGGGVAEGFAAGLWGKPPSWGRVCLCLGEGAGRAEEGCPLPVGVPSTPLTPGLGNEKGGIRARCRPGGADLIFSRA